MLERISRYLATAIVDAAPGKTQSKNVLEYYIKVTLNFFAVVVLSVLVGVGCNIAPETITALSSFVLLRMFSGGYHVKSLDACVLITTCIIVGIPLLSEYVQVESSVVTAVAAGLVLLFSPRNVQSTIKPRAYPWLKVISLVIVCSNLGINSPIIAMTFMVQALLLIPKGGEITK
ncbi:accessory gene regulator B family protein [Brevibacillus sp. HD1.4A]|uniref:accessory gene regulator B family protein n=1 Tax=Brevibacillus sp. HD1.4A TaxID=2738978 RepID=UPI00156BD615|nr:accessory gene regulator B family protein [Brevibacillus sp. HD1.4A]NRQ51939.1 accessory gene regulator B family protein [Brevibacillus sp. HD1.4A]